MSDARELSEQTKVCNESDNRKYRTEIPNIVFDIGLTCHELALYGLFKRIAGAGKNGYCSLSTRNLAKRIGLSAGKVSETKRSLAASRTELENSPLIAINKAKHYDVVTILNIWHLNAEFVLSKRSPGEQERSPGEQERSSGEPKKELFKKEPLKKSPIVPLKGDEVTSGFERARNLFNIRPSTPLDSAQERAWRSSAPCVEATTEDEWKTLEWWFKQPGGEGEMGQFRRKTLSTLLNHWTDEILKARDAAKKAGVRVQTFSRSANTEPPPEFCESFLREQDSDANEEFLTSPFSKLPDSIRSYVAEAYRDSLRSAGGKPISQFEQETQAQTAWRAKAGLITNT